MANESLIPIAWLRERYAYDPLTGDIRFKTGHSKMRGAVAGTINEDGYRIIRAKFEGRRIELKAHRLAWALHYGEHPLLEVDHEDLGRDHNWIDNLRHATRQQNVVNRACRVTDLPRGVTRRKGSKPFEAAIGVAGRSIYLGRFDCPVAAHRAYCVAASEHHGEFARAS